MTSCLFQNAHQLFIDKYLKNSVDCFDKQSIVFLQQLKQLFKSIESDFNNLLRALLNQILFLELILD